MTHSSLRNTALQIIQHPHFPGRETEPQSSNFPEPLTTESSLESRIPIQQCNLRHYHKSPWAFVSTSVKWGHSQLPCLLFGIKHESTLLTSKPYANKCVCDYIKPNNPNPQILRGCVCTQVHESGYRTGPYMKTFTLLNLDRNLILRLVAKKRILSPLHLRRSLKMDGPLGTHRQVSTARETRQLRSRAFISVGVRLGSGAQVDR